MGEKAKVKETVRLYSKVWQLPSFGGIVLRLGLSVIAVSTVLSLLKTISLLGWNALTAFVEYALLFGVPTSVGVGLLYLIIREPGAPLDLRRTVGSVLFAVIFWFVVAVLGGVVDTLVGIACFEARFILLGMGMAYFALSFLITGLSERHPLRNFLGSLMPPLTLLVSWIPLTWQGAFVPQLPQSGLAMMTIMVIVDALAVNYIFSAVSRPFERDLGISGPGLLRAFGHAYLVDNPIPFERMMTQIAVEQDVPIEVLVVHSGDEIVAVAVTLYVHPGPFRDIGSSALPSVIINHIEDKYGAIGLVFHGTCTHHQNLTSKDDFPRVLAEIDRLIANAETHSEVGGPVWSDEGKFKVWTIFSGDDVLAITTSYPHFTDDISLEVGKQAATLVRQRVPGIRGVCIVDAHNCIGEDAVSVMPGDPDAEEYVASVASAVFGTANAPRRPVEVGIYRLTDHGLTITDGIGPGGIAAFIIKSAENESVIVVVDGNNVEPGYRDRVVGLLKGQGFANVEIVTTDTHIVNAVSLSHKGYPPVGRERPDDVLDAIGIAVTKARESMRPASIGLEFGEVRGVKTFGERGFDTLTLDVAEAASIAKRTGLGLAGGTALFLILLSLLL
ncbi:MAG: DUF2070 family protein [Candidatus Thorarchaeota archaeon]